MSRGDGGTAGPLGARAARLAHYRFGMRLGEIGRVLAVGDGIAWVEGLPSATMDEVLEFEDESLGLVFHLGHDALGTILLRQGGGLTAGARVRRSGRTLDLPVGDALAGRTVDPLGAPLDGGAVPEGAARRALDGPSPPITARDFVDRPLYTGNKIIDTLIPIGRGQRQLIIGDNGLGKTSLAVDAIISQKGKNVYCVYVAIGQKRSEVVNVIETLTQAGAMAYTTLVVADASGTPGLRYLAPFAGCALAEAAMWDGHDSLVVYDDLSTHARAYRELSLLLRRPPGREAYPGDIFYLHSRLLERSTRLAAPLGGGSMTALPIIETEQGDIASYIPTNLISITDGQIYLERRLFAAGFLPAIDVTRSVSRIGGNAQHPRIKEEAGRMKLDYLQYLELEVFTRFGAHLEASIEAKIQRGRLLRECLKQERLAPLSAEFEMAWLVAFNEGLLGGRDARTVAALLGALDRRIAEAGLQLTDERARWVAAVADFLAGA
ncbi:MAG: F0F1 ATP synthase subunit alpha [Betaproteobacteria bacterium]|nr:F0F1 ATP synthase subunit alpha [Betaproteobacteria bacterium]